MTLLLDTHVLLWWLSGDDRVSSAMSAAISNTSTRVLVSAASTWEITLKSERGKLHMPDGLLDELERQGFEGLPITPGDGVAAGALPPHHRDPFDRMIIAQAMSRDLLLVSADRQFMKYDVRLLQ